MNLQQTTISSQGIYLRKIPRQFTVAALGIMRKKGKNLQNQIKDTRNGRKNGRKKHKDRPIQDTTLTGIFLTNDKDFKNILWKDIDIVYLDEFIK